MPSKNGDRLSNLRALQNVRQLQVAKHLDRKVKAVDRLHTSPELLLILLLGARRAAKDLSPAPTAKMLEQRLPAARLWNHKTEVVEISNSSKPRVERQVVVPSTERLESSNSPCKYPSVCSTPTFILVGAGLFGVSFAPLPMMRQALIQPSKIKQGKKPNP